MRRLRRWPWLLLLLGATVLFHFLLALRARHVREGFQRREGDGFFRGSALSGELTGLSRGMAWNGAAAALVRLNELRNAPSLSPGDRAQIEVVRTRAEVQLGWASEGALWTHLRWAEEAATGWRALQELYELRKARGNAEEQVAFLERVVDGEVEISPALEFPIPYLAYWAAWELIEFYRVQGDARCTHEWALRLKHEFPVHIDAGCGSAVAGAHEALEDLLAVSAERSGRFYVREPFRWDWLDRRTLGPTPVECAAGMSAGAVLMFAGVMALTRREGRWPGRLFPGRLFWVRRGWRGWLPLAMLMLWFLAGEGFILKESLAFGEWPSPDELGWLMLIGIPHAALGIPLAGCFLGEPPLRDRRLRIRRATPRWARCV